MRSGSAGARGPPARARERARTAVTYRVRAAIRKLDQLHPELGRHLANSVRTGTWCSYRPETDVTLDDRAPRTHSVRRILTSSG